MKNGPKSVQIGIALWMKYGPKSVQIGIALWVQNGPKSVQIGIAQRSLSAEGDKPPSVERIFPRCSAATGSQAGAPEGGGRVKIYWRREA